LGIISVGIYSYFIALDKRERQKIKNLVSKYIVLRDK
jgi:hypothetical protein